ncbi:MAG: aminotransferase class I/II-fold pyridoxal phosphate-dependent enzyme [Eggerthellaceae bacterium]
MKPFEALTELVNEASVVPQRQETLPYDIRAEIDWIDFSCIANPLGTPSCIREAVSSAISEGDLSFAPNSDGQHLSRVLGRYFEIPAECILAGTSVTSLIGAIAQAYRPCNVGIPTPAPTGYFLSVANVGHNPVKLINPYSLSAIEPQTAFSNGHQFNAAVLANPSFPCGRLLSEKVLKRYLEVCNWVVVDEANIGLTLGGESFVELTQKYRNLFVIRSLSAELGMPGIPMGYVVGNAAAIEHIKQFVDGSEITLFNEVVAREFPRTEEYLDETVQLLESEIPWMQCMLSLTPGIKVFPSEANFVMCALEERAARDFGIASASDLIVRLQKAGFTLRDLDGVPGIEGKRYFLVSIRSHEENEKLISALRDIITES